MKIWFRVAGENETLATAIAPAAPRVGEVVKVELRPGHVFEGIVENVEWQYAHIEALHLGEASADAIVVVTKRVR